jgi:tetratricopeptide (TPR) repeat protein
VGQSWSNPAQEIAVADQKASKPAPTTTTAKKRPVIKKRVGAKKRVEELEQPDEFMEVGGTVVDWVLANGKMVGAVVGGILAILLVWGLVQRIDRTGREGASAALYEAEKLLPGGDALSPRLGPITLSTETTDEDREAKTTEAVAALDAVISEHGRTPQANVARLDAGGALFRIGKYDEALGYFTEAARAKGAVGTFAVGAKAATLESLDRWDEAISEYRSLRDRTAGPMKEQATIDLARVHESQGDFAGARTLYTEFEGEFPDSTRLDEVQAKAAAIEGK